MFNNPLGPDVRLFGSSINPSDVILYLPMTSTFADSGYYGLTYTAQDPNATAPSIVSVTSNSGTYTSNWGKFGWSGSGASQANSRRSSGIIFNNAVFNAISNSSADFTIEFNVKIVGDGQSDSNGAALKVFPFSIVGALVNSVVTSTTSAGYGPGTTVAPAGDIAEMGMTIGSHTSPGGFGLGAGAADGSNIGYAAACTSNDSNANSYVNRGFAAVPSGNASTWGPYYIAIVRKSGVVTIFMNGKKINTQLGADEDGDGTQDTGSTWNWNTFLINSTTPGSTANTSYGNKATLNGFFIGGSYTYSSYGYDDDLYLQHFRVTRNTARYTADYTPESIYNVSP